MSKRVIILPPPDLRDVKGKLCGLAREHGADHRTAMPGDQREAAGYGVIQMRTHDNKTPCVMRSRRLAD